MRNKEKLYEWIVRYNNNDLSPEELELFLEMLRRNPRIREEVRLDEDLSIFLREADQIDLRRKIRKVIAEKQEKKGNGKRLLLMAASILILLSAEALIFYFTRHGDSGPVSGFVFSNPDTPGKLMNTSENETAGNDTVTGFHIRQNPGETASKTAEKDEAPSTLLACYKPDKALEIMAATAIRSGEFRMIKPGKTATVLRDSIITFSWKTASPEQTSVQIMNNKGKIVFESESNSIRTLSINASFLGRGLFYYRVLKQDEAIYFGKITIR